MKRLESDNNILVFDGLDQDSKEWLDWRGEGIGSSDIALLMSPEPVFDRTVGTLWSQRCGYERAPELNNEHIHRGKRLEPVIRDKVNSILGTDFVPECVARADAEYLRASLDGIDYEKNAILEIKSPSDSVFEKYVKTWEIPENYYLQMQYQMLCSNTDCAYFSFGRERKNAKGEVTEELELYIIPVRNDHSLQLDIERRCALFWKGVQNKIPVGWKGDKLSLYHTNPTIFIIVCDEEQQKKIYRTVNLPLPVGDVGDHTKSCIYPIVDLKELPAIKAALPEHSVKIISLISSPLSNAIDNITVTKKGLTDKIKSMI